MRKTFLFKMIFIAITGFAVISSCTQVKNDFSVTKEGDIRFRESEIQLRFDSIMNMRIFYKQDINQLNVSGRETQGKPSHFVVVNGEELTGFVVNYDSIKVLPVENEFGKGKNLILKGVAKLKDGTPIEKTLIVGLYEKYPNAAIISAIYKNFGTSNVIVDEAVSNYLIMDSSVDEPGIKPFDFWSFQGSSLAWGLDNVIHITDGFNQENWMGV
ncbi:MAG TPA: hypothetical protein P5210_14445, partial [Draconibacterium sp.]|nr:hypothetical protein [Draconibacterium sp.]